jgi:hypothetical protein
MGHVRGNFIENYLPKMPLAQTLTPKTPHVISPSVTVGA